MEYLKLKQILKTRTLNMFSEDFYTNLTNHIIKDYTGADTSGYVYFVRIKNSNKCKIGMTQNIMDRLNSFKTTLGSSMQLDGFIYSEKYKEIEKELHKNLINRTIHGEWFDIDFKMVVNILINHNGIQSMCLIDNQLIITDGVLINCKKNITSLNVDDGYIFNAIKKYMESNSLTNIIASAKEINENIFTTEYFNCNQLRRTLNKKFYTSKLIRYNSIFKNKSVVGLTYSIDLDKLNV